MDVFYWIPEAPEFPGVYANLNGTDRCYGKIQNAKLQPSTLNVDCAQKFVTFEDCQEWCNLNPYPKFEPKQHGFWKDGNTTRLKDNSIISP